MEKGGEISLLLGVHSVDESPFAHRASSGRPSSHSGYERGLLRVGTAWVQGGGALPGHRTSEQIQLFHSPAARVPGLVNASSTGSGCCRVRRTRPCSVPCHHRLDPITVHHPATALRLHGRDRPTYIQSTCVEHIVVSRLRRGGRRTPRPALVERCRAKTPTADGLLSPLVPHSPTHRPARTCFRRATLERASTTWFSYPVA